MLASQGGKRRRDQPKGWTWRERWTRGRGSHSTLAAAHCHGCSESRNAYIDLKRGNPERQTPRDRVRRPPPAARRRPRREGGCLLWDGARLGHLPRPPASWRLENSPQNEGTRPTHLAWKGRAAGGGRRASLSPGPSAARVHCPAISSIRPPLPPCELGLPLPATACLVLLVVPLLVSHFAQEHDQGGRPPGRHLQFGT